ncbi:delta-60 repeat domain-containing protein [Pseudomonas sp. NFACC15-1]|uniref:delta-60 repeat domain-containing protein n=1 Tax=unclassified Pseudomonas TaxID=196821 RepID=UPI0008818870|nr:MULTISPECIES: delta-60 repeat domain-containing protein [unclassified Pseudomonas]SDA92963.1 delta-60 repeat domain-containing protein [Pseudomonas sp. NFACC15-1]SDZ07693.1 delta-60 repeat domain-containing protein [Pseudomonas sp. NFACC14]
MAQAPSAVQAGTLDPTFAEEGVLTLPTPDLTGYRTLAILPLAENKLLITVLLPGDPAPIRLAKVNEDGSLDMEFGGAGTGLVEFSIKNTDMEVYQLCGLGDGGWLVIGQFSSFEQSGAYVVRFLEDGRLNTFFGEDGVRLLPYRNEPRDEGKEDGPVTFSRRDPEPSAGVARSSGNQGVSAVVQPDGKIVLPSWVEFGSSPGQWAVLRLNPDGSTDDTFNGSGFVVIELPGIPRTPASIRSVVLQADGQVLVCGEYSSQDTPDSNGIYVIRLDVTGRLDTSFNGGVGVVTVANPTFMNANAMALRESDDAIVVVGDIWRDQYRHGLMFVLSRDGFFDFAFNSGQPLFSRLVGQGHDWYCCAWQADGSILVGGSTGRGVVEEGVSALTARFRSDGSLDLTFNGTGFVLFDEEGQYETVEDMALMPDGRIVVGGFARLPGPVWSRIIGSWILRYLA